MPESRGARSTVGDAHRPLRHAVLAELRRRIIAAEWQPGDRLFEDQIASDLGVSRYPVREALQALAAERFVELEPRRGARVATMPPERATELFEVREALEGLVARLAAERRSEAQLHEMRAVVGEGIAAVAADDLAALPGLNTRYHHCLCEAASNGMLTDFVHHLRHVIEWVYASRIAARAAESWQEHAGIVDAVAAGDAQLAGELAAAHIAAARRAYLMMRGS